MVSPFGLYSCWCFSLSGSRRPAQAQPVDFAGKTVTLAIATPSGGGDLYGRMVARHIGRYLPGNPTVVPQGGGPCSACGERACAGRMIHSGLMPAAAITLPHFS